MRGEIYDTYIETLTMKERALKAKAIVDAREAENWRLVEQGKKRYVETYDPLQRLKRYWFEDV